MTISSRTPEGTPNHCPICKKDLLIEPSLLTGDAPCPHCGSLLWFVRGEPETYWFDHELSAELRERLRAAIAERFDVSLEELPERLKQDDIGVDSLDLVELVMELEDELGKE